MTPSTITTSRINRACVTAAGIESENTPLESVIALPSAVPGVAAHVSRCSQRNASTWAPAAGTSPSAPGFRTVPLTVIIGVPVGVAVGVPVGVGGGGTGLLVGVPVGEGVPVAVSVGISVGVSVGV